MKISGQYKAAFLIPYGSKKILDEDGWTFEIKNALHKSIVDEVIDVFDLSFVERYDDVVTYACNAFKATIFFDKEGNVEQIYFQIFNKKLQILDALKAQFGVGDAELFVP